MIYSTHIANAFKTQQNATSIVVVITTSKLAVTQIDQVHKLSGGISGMCNYVGQDLLTKIRFNAKFSDTHGIDNSIIE